MCGDAAGIGAVLAAWTPPWWCGPVTAALAAEADSTSVPAVAAYAMSDMLIFVRRYRGRVEEYIAFRKEMLDYLKQQKAAHPELETFLSDMERITTGLPSRIEGVTSPGTMVRHEASMIAWLAAGRQRVRGRAAGRRGRQA